MLAHVSESTYRVQVGSQEVDLPLASLNEKLTLALLITVDLGVSFMTTAGGVSAAAMSAATRSGPTADQPSSVSVTSRSKA